MIVVDAAIHPFRGKLYCHMASDIVGDAGLAELHRFARFLGLQRDWFQDKDLPHYDLSPSKRARALAHKAKAIGITECAGLISCWRAWKVSRPTQLSMEIVDEL